MGKLKQCFEDDPSSDLLMMLRAALPSVRTHPLILGVNEGASGSYSQRSNAEERMSIGSWLGER